MYRGEKNYSWVTRILCFIGAVLLFCTLPLLFYPRKFGQEIGDACARHGVPPALVYAVIYAESGFDPNAVSKKGAAGLMQLMPATAEWCALKKGDAGFKASELTDPAYNIDLGVYYLSYLLKRFSERDAVAAYNAGEGNVSAWLARGAAEIPFPETLAYVGRVMRAKRVYEIMINDE